MLRKAKQLMDSVHTKADAEPIDLDTAVNQVLDNKREMFILMKEYCLEV